MIASFRSESKGAMWMALVLAVAVVSLTDATAGEPHRVMMKKLSPAAEATMQKLEQKISVELNGASIEQIVGAVSSQTGVVIATAPDAIDQTVRDTTIDLKAENIPAHAVLIESLGAVDLALEFDDAGNAQIQRLPEGTKLRMPVPETEDGAIERDVIIVNKGKGGDERLPEPIEDQAGDGVARRKVMIRGSEGGQAEGTFSLEVHRIDASSKH